VELFETTGHVEQAEILYDGTRSKGAGVVQFAHVEEAETAIGLLSCVTRAQVDNANFFPLQLNSASTCMGDGRLVRSDLPVPCFS
jgi:RNA recognition motif. (a.k.a. RRM, RBD, or RNP domain)